MMKVYIAEPMRGYAYFNFPKFFEVEARLEHEGYVTVNPARLDIDKGFDPYIFDDDSDWSSIKNFNFNLRDAVKRDIDAILQCDAIYLMKGWENSKGAQVEKAVAEWLELDILYEKKEDILEEALRLTGGERQEDYGSPAEDFSRTAKMWSGLKGVEFT